MSSSEQSITILQVSDLESALVFRKPMGTPDSEWTDQARWGAAVDLLKDSLTRASSSHIDVLIINGDCIKGVKEKKESTDTKRASFSEFAECFVVPLANHLHEVHHTRSVIIVPGNHDVDRNSIDASASPNQVTERLTPFFEMVGKVAKDLQGKLEVNGAPMAATEPINVVRFGGVDGFELFPLNSALLSGANIEMITEVLSGRGSKVLEEKAITAMFTASKAIEKVVTGVKDVDSELKKRLSSDAAFVPQQHLAQIALAHTKKKSSSTGPCRVAIVHHNSIPYPHETSTRVKSYGFCNSGAFHDKLAEGGFSYILHGHQHEPRVFEFADHSQVHSDEECDPRRLLFIGAACFGSDETPEGRMGFNIIRLSKPALDACRAEISHVVLSTTASAGVDPATLSVKTVNYVSAVPPFRNRKQRTAEQLFRNCLQTSHLERYERCLRLEDPTAESFYSEFRRTRDEFQNLYAIYSISVFEPKLWGEQRFAEFFLPEARHNLARAAAVAKSLEAEIAASALHRPSVGVTDIGEYFQRLIHSAVPGLHFRFSQPIFSAVRQSNRNAEELKIASRFSKSDGIIDEALVQSLVQSRPRDVQNREINFFTRTLKGPRHAALQGPVNIHDSLSIWDNAAKLANLKLDDPDIPNIPEQEMQAVAERLLSRPFYEGVSLSISPIPKFVPRKPQPMDIEYVQLQEFPRIVLWTMEQFLQPQALECIEFHEYSGFPLFWINPERLVGPLQQLRKRYGHYSIIGQTAGRQVDHRARPNDEHGTNLELKDMASEDDSEPGITGAIWGKSNVPKELTTDADHIDEFMYLVQRPDLIFAADAWAISRLGKTAWDEMELFLTAKQS